MIKILYPLSIYGGFREDEEGKTLPPAPATFRQCTHVHTNK